MTENKACFFVCGALRSGTSLLHLMLNHHPNITNPGELDFFFDKVNDDNQPPDLNEYKTWLSSHRIFLAKKLKYPENAKNFSDVLLSFHGQLSEANKVLAINIHRHFNKIPFFFPYAKYIHLIRDPRDVARSSIGMGWAGNVYYGVDHWLDSERSWETLQSKLSDQQYIEVHFEDLITKPQETLEVICKFLGVPFDPSMLDYYENSTYEKPDVSLIYQWRTKLSANEVMFVESKAGKELQKLNYQMNNDEVPKISFIKKLHLLIQNKFFKLKFSIKKYGFSLVLLEKLTRWIKCESVSNATRMKMNDIDRLHIK